MASNDAEDNVALRGNTQAYLVNSLRQLLPAMHKKRGGQYTEHLVHTRFRSTELVSEFNKTSGIMDYMNALPAQLSGLMPKIRIFLRQPAGANGKRRADIPVHFSGYTSATYKPPSSTASGGRLNIFAKQAEGRDVGITRFHVSIDNKFKFASVQASMELYFRNMADLSQGPYLHLIRLMKKTEGSYKKEEYDLKKRAKFLANKRKEMRQRITIKGKRTKVRPAKAVSPAAERIDPAPLKAVIGWATSKNNELPQDISGATDTKRLYKFLERSALTLLLNVNKYSIDFGDKGEVKLSIEMTGYADEALAGTNEASIFTNPWDVTRGSVNNVGVKGKKYQGAPTGIKNQSTIKPVSVQEIFGERIDKLNLVDVPTLLVDPLAAGASAKANKSKNPKKAVGATFVSDQNGYLTSLLAELKTNVQGLAAADLAKTKVKIDTKVLKHLIDITETDIQIIQLLADTSSGRILNEMRENLSKFKKIYKATGEANKGSVYRNFLERLEAVGALMSITVKMADLGITLGFESKPNPNPDPTNATIDTTTVEIDRSLVKNRYMTSPPNLGGAASIAHATKEAAGGISKAERDKLMKANGVASGAPFTIAPNAGKNPSTATASIVFVRLGDIIDTAFHSSGFFTHNKGKKDGTFRVVLDTLYLNLPGTSRNKLTPISLADIPIQLSAFEYFFFEKYVKKNAVNVPLRGFLDELMSFVAAEMSNSGILGEDTKFDPMILPFTAPNVYGRPLRPKRTYTRTSREFVSSDRNPRGFAAKREAEASMGMETLNNYLVLSLIQNPRRHGNSKKDAARGIYHLVLAAGRGPVKAIKFSEQDTSEHIRTMNIRDGSADFPTVPQNATVDLVGAPHFWQGQLVYIDADYAMPNASVVMGIGGYYIVTKVTHDLDAGNFTTKLECRWQAYKELKGKATSKRSSN